MGRALWSFGLKGGPSSQLMTIRRTSLTASWRPEWTGMDLTDDVVRGFGRFHGHLFQPVVSGLGGRHGQRQPGNALLSCFRCLHPQWP